MFIELRKQTITEMWFPETPQSLSHITRDVSIYQSIHKHPIRKEINRSDSQKKRCHEKI
jgi:hypothetical protein